jgi:hypothetical protein
MTTAGAAVFLLFDALPFQDLPAHAGLISLRHRLGTSAFDQRYYLVSSHLGPYSLFRFLGEALLPWVGPVGAVRTMAVLPVIATPLALLWARRRLHGDRSPTAAYFGLALSFGFMTALGLESYLLGIPALLVVLTLWLELLVAVDTADRSALWREALVACVAPLLFLAHGHAFAIFALLAGVSAVATERRRASLVKMRALAPAFGLAAWAEWTQRASVLPPGAAQPANVRLQAYFQGPLDKLSLLITPTLLTRTGIDALVGVALWAVLASCIVATAASSSTPEMSGAPPPSPAIRNEVRTGSTGKAELAHSRTLIACLWVLAAAFIVLPHAIGWFGFIDGRLVPLLLMLAVMALRPQALRRPLLLAYQWCGPIAAGAMVTLALGASHFFQAEARGWHSVLAQIPAESRVLNLPIDPNSDVFAAHPFAHYDKLVMAERPIVVSDVWFHQGSALYPTADNPVLRLPASYSESDLRFIDWPAYRLSDWDYVLIRTRTGSAQPWVPENLAFTAHAGGWWLFRTR